MICDETDEAWERLEQLLDMKRECGKINQPTKWKDEINEVEQRIVQVKQRGDCDRGQGASHEGA